MELEKFRWLAGLIAAHQSRTVRGRTRLQKEVRLLQRLGFPTTYSFSIYFYGPYSEDITSDLALLKSLQLVKEELEPTPSGDLYILKADSKADLPEIETYLSYIELLSRQELVVLELAATYDAYRQMHQNHADAITSLRIKKGGKCTGQNVTNALSLLSSLGLASS